MDTKARNQFIARKLDEGLSLPEVQKLLASEHDVTMTYLELRLAAAELEVNWKKHDKAPPPAPPDIAEEPPEATSRTRVSISKLVRPGASMSGEVEFASGAKAEWYVDAMGRLGLQPEQGSDKPTREDLEEFQAELQRKLTGGAA